MCLLSSIFSLFRCLPFPALSCLVSLLCLALFLSCSCHILPQCPCHVMPSPNCFAVSWFALIRLILPCPVLLGRNCLVLLCLSFFVLPCCVVPCLALPYCFALLSCFALISCLALLCLNCFALPCLALP